MMRQTENNSFKNIANNSSQFTVNYATLNQQLDVKNLCSRKLMELLTTHSYQPQQLTASERNSVLQELLTRRHYLVELEQFGLSA